MSFDMLSTRGFKPLKGSYFPAPHNQDAAQT
jgi:hypothetical protein